MQSQVKNTSAVNELPQDSVSSNHYPNTTSSSSFTSIMSNPLAARISFQTFTNLLPSSWSTSRSLAGSCQAMPTGLSTSLGHDQKSSTRDTVTVGKRGPRFVSKEKQLEKLRSRLERKDVKSDVGACNSCQDQALFV